MAEPFFLPDDFDGAIGSALRASGELLYTRSELSDAFPRFNLDFGNAYHVWGFDPDTVVWLAGREARLRIDRSLWAAIREAQGRNGRGHVYGGDWPVGIETPDIDRLDDGRYLLAPDTWRSLDAITRRRWLHEWISRRLVEDGLGPDRPPLRGPTVAPAHRDLVDRYAGTFADTSGPNCFGAALGAALDRPEEIFPLWLHQGPFLRALSGVGYRPVPGSEPHPGDVVVWANATGQPVHAAFCVGDGLLFNKNGQSWEQPYAVVALADVLDFDGTVSAGGAMTIYRRG